MESTYANHILKQLILKHGQKRHMEALESLTPSIPEQPPFVLTTEQLALICKARPECTKKHISFSDTTCPFFVDHECVCADTPSTWFGPPKLWERL